MKSNPRFQPSFVLLFEKILNLYYYFKGPILWTRKDNTITSDIAISQGCNLDRSNQGI